VISVTKTIFKNLKNGKYRSGNYAKSAFFDSHKKKKLMVDPPVRRGVPEDYRKVTSQYAGTDSGDVLTGRHPAPYSHDLPDMTCSSEQVFFCVDYAEISERVFCGATRTLIHTSVYDFQLSCFSSSIISYSLIKVFI